MTIHEPANPDIHRSFATLLGDLEGGAFHAELSQEITRIVGELENAYANRGGKPKGKLSISIDFTLDSKMMRIAASYNTTLPKAVRGDTFMFITPENHLSRRDTQQMDLPLRDVNSTAAQPRTA